MSLQNLYEPNNETIYCKNLEAENLTVTGNTTLNSVTVNQFTVDNITVESITVDNITVESITVNDVQVNNITADNGTFTNVQVDNITADDGTFTNLNVGTLGGIGSNPINVNDGFIFSGLGNTLFNVYSDISGFLGAGGCYTGISNLTIPYNATRIGQCVTFSFSIEVTALPDATSNQEIQLLNLPTQLQPQTAKVASTLNMNVNNTYPLGAIYISGSTIHLYSDLDLNAGFITGRVAYYDYPLNTVVCFTYNLS